MASLPEGYPTEAFAAFDFLKTRPRLSVEDLKVLAMIECYGETFYEILAQGVQDDEARALLLRNAAEERGHAHRCLKAISLLGGELDLPAKADNPFMALAPAEIPMNAELIGLLEKGEVDGDLDFEADAGFEFEPDATFEFAVDSEVEVDADAEVAPGVEDARPAAAEADDRDHPPPFATPRHHGIRQRDPRHCPRRTPAASPDRLRSDPARAGTASRFARRRCGGSARRAREHRERVAPARRSPSAGCRGAPP